MQVRDEPAEPLRLLLGIDLFVVGAKTVLRSAVEHEHRFAVQPVGGPVRAMSMRALPRTSTAQTACANDAASLAATHSASTSVSSG